MGKARSLHLVSSESTRARGSSRQATWKRGGRAAKQTAPHRRLEYHKAGGRPLIRRCWSLDYCLPGKLGLCLIFPFFFCKEKKGGLSALTLVVLWSRIVYSFVCIFSLDEYMYKYIQVYTTIYRLIVQVQKPKPETLEKGRSICIGAPGS